jgi:polyisoprenoid-binding protein YceI
MNLSSTPLSRALLTLSFASLAWACNTDPAKGKTEATVTSAAAPVAAAPAASAVNYAFSNDGSTVQFVGAKITAKHEGSFKAFRGTISVVDADPTKSNVNAEIDIASLSIEPAKLAGHLKTPDFFDAEKFPKITFKSKSVKAKGSDELSVTGDLTIHGVTKEVVLEVEGPSAPSTDPFGNVRVGATATTKIKREDFGLVWNAALEAGGVLVGNEVKITIDISAIKQK